MELQPLYPLTFKTIFKDKLWGGEKIRDILGKDFSPLPNCGETWEISGVAGNISEVKTGPLAGQNLVDLIEWYKGDLVGDSVFKQFGTDFPLLVKFIDANDDLSIQVHPDDALAQKRHGSFGKTEMWYIFQADEGASLISGFNQALDKQTYLDHFHAGNLLEILNREHAVADDVFFLPAGRVHTIGKGLLLAEIQQTSDITYRIYDFDRKDANGNTRELHVEEALDAIDYTYHDSYKTQYKKAKNEVVQLATCPYFTTNRLDYTASVHRDYSQLDSFVIYVCMEGGFDLKYAGGSLEVQKGDAVLLPACIQSVDMDPKGSFKIMESFVS